MKAIRDFDRHIDQQKIFDRLELYENSNQYQYYLEIYKVVLEEFIQLVEPEGYYCLKENKLGKSFHSDFDLPSHVVYCLITLGESISNRSTEMFRNNDPFMGLLLDAVANEFLFDISEKFYLQIKEDIYEKQGFGLTKRYSPGDEGICLSYQKAILESFGNSVVEKIGITRKFMYRPSKTLGYVYGADPDHACSEKEHDCSCCSQKNCNFRKRSHLEVESCH